MKQRKNKRNLLIVSVLLLALCLTGCGLFKSDTQKLKDLLEDKYGEKFGVESYYYAGDMWAMCYPVSDPTLLFEVRTNDKVTFIGHDYYLQTVVQRQVDEELQPLVEQAFPGSFVSSDLSATDYEGQTADKVSLESMIQHSNLLMENNSGRTYIMLNIFVNTSENSEENIEEEYAFIAEEIGGRVARGELPDTSIYLYFGDEKFVNDCRNILSETTWSQNDIYQSIKECPVMRIGYEDEGIPLNGSELTLQKYMKDKSEVLYNG